MTRDDWGSSTERSYELRLNADALRGTTRNCLSHLKGSDITGQVVLRLSTVKFVRVIDIAVTNDTTLDKKVDNWPASLQWLCAENWETAAIIC